MVASAILRQGEREPEIMRDAVKIARWLAAAAPRLDVELANLLRSSARSLSVAGEHERALADTEESLRICRRGLSTGRFRYRVGLAKSLYMQADILDNLERYPEAAAAAHEAVELSRTGVGEEPRRFGPVLLASLDILARAFSALGESQQDTAEGL
ncbi:hypothetical protein ACQP1O_36365 [Nocardia sp. CA-151230]|uniref:hypothetical protein n=1 Tax=Nocardia sp. CA-151230 TaxID=3239982 RepID=UPI003D8D1ED0